MHGDKIIASLLATLTTAFLALWAVAPGLAVSNSLAGSHGGLSGADAFGVVVLVFGGCL